MTIREVRNTRPVIRPNLNLGSLSKKAEARSHQSGSRLLPVVAAGSLVYAALVILALPTALLLTAWALYAVEARDLAETSIWLSRSLNENMLASSIFFWLELFGIVGSVALGSEIVKRMELARRTKGQIEALHANLAAALDCIDEERVEFADRLINSETPDGMYATSLQYMEVSLRFIQNRFVTLQLTNADLTEKARQVMFDIANKLDDMVADCYWNTEDAIIARRKGDVVGLDKALVTLFEECDTSDPDGLLTIYVDLYRQRGLTVPPSLLEMYLEQLKQRGMDIPEGLA